METINDYLIDEETKTMIKIKPTKEKKRRKPRKAKKPKKVNESKVIEKAQKKKYNEIKSGAKKRNKTFELTFDSFIQFWKKPCHYCGDNVLTYGLDRVDNNQGYRLDNVVSCCFTCNSIKRILPISIFLSHIKKILDNYDKKIDYSDLAIKQVSYDIENIQKEKYLNYKRITEKYNKIFTLSFEEYIKFWQKPCLYCSSEIKYINIDRIDKNKGYVLGNITSCCRTCSSMKGLMTISDFIDHIKKINKIYSIELEKLESRLTNKYESNIYSIFWKMG
jgi:hypothetical protein